jgi:AAA domain
MKIIDENEDKDKEAFWDTVLERELDDAWCGCHEDPDLNPKPKPPPEPGQGQEPGPEPQLQPQGGSGPGCEPGHNTADSGPSRGPESGRSGGVEGDDVFIGCAEYVRSDLDLTGSWADVANQIDGTRWLVRGWVPYRMLSGTIGEPKAGKSGWVLWNLVRPLITGCDWFTGQPGASPKDWHNVIWCDTEGTIGLNIDRMKQWGLPMDRVKFPFANEPFRRVDLDSNADIRRIFDVVCRYAAPLVVVDSFRGAHRGDENSSRCGAGLQKLAEIAERTGAAVHVIHHTGKLPPGVDISANNARGSNVYLAMVRCLVGIDFPDPNQDRKNPWRRVRMLLESFGASPLAHGFRWGVGCLEMGRAPQRPEREKRETGKDRAEDWLRVRMRPGVWYPAVDITAEAEAAGFSPTGTLQRAKAALRVQTRKGGGSWQWMRGDIGQDITGTDR